MTAEIRYLKLKGWKRAPGEKMSYPLIRTISISTRNKNPQETIDAQLKIFSDDWGGFVHMEYEDTEVTAKLS